LWSLLLTTTIVGAGALLTGGAPGKTIVDTTRCAVDWVRVMFGLGARNFLFMNVCLNCSFVATICFPGAERALTDDPTTPNSHVLADGLSYEVLPRPAQSIQLDPLHGGGDKRSKRTGTIYAGRCRKGAWRCQHRYFALMCWLITWLTRTRSIRCVLAFRRHVPHAAELPQRHPPVQRHRVREPVHLRG